MNFGETPQRVEKLPVTASGPRFGFENARFGTLGSNLKPLEPVFAAMNVPGSGFSTRCHLPLTSLNKGRGRTSVPLRGLSPPYSIRVREGSASWVLCCKLPRGPTPVKPLSLDASQRPELFSESFLRLAQPPQVLLTQSKLQQLASSKQKRPSGRHGGHGSPHASAPPKEGSMKQTV